MENKPQEEEKIPAKRNQPQVINLTVSPVLFPSENSYAKLTDIAKAYQIPKQELLEQVEQGKLPATRMAKTWSIKKEHFEQFLVFYKEQKALENYRAILQDKRDRIKEERNKLNEAMKTLGREKQEPEPSRKEEPEPPSREYMAQEEVIIRKKINRNIESTGMYGWMIRELSLLIPNERQREIFIEISHGRKIREVANRRKLTQEAVRNDYRAAIQILNGKFGFLKNYRKSMSELYYRVRTQELTLRLFEEELMNLLEIVTLKQIAREPDWNKKPAAIVNMLSTPLEKLGYGKVSLLALKTKNIQTLEELMWYIVQNGFASLIHLDKVGKGTMDKIRDRLQEIGILNENQEITLFKEEPPAV